MFAAIAEAGREKRRALSEKDRAAAHKIPGQIAGLAADRQGARNHAAARIGACAAFDENEATPQPVPGPCAYVSAHMQETAAHTDRLAAQRASETLARVTLDVQRSAFHTRAGERARIAANGQLSARHQAPGFDADFTLDADRA